MKNMISGKNGMHFTTRLLRSTALAVTGLALGFTLWTAATPAAVAQGQNPARMIEAALPQGQTMASAGKADLLSAVCAAVRKNRNSAPQIVRVAVTARPEWSGDIQRSAFECLGSRDCALLGRVLRQIIAADPDNAASATELALQLAPDCAGSFPGTGGGGPDDPPGFGGAPLNQNPPPGSIGGSGAGSNTVAVCIRGRTVFVSPRGAENLIRNNPGATVGPCVVTPIRNP